MISTVLIMAISGDKRYTAASSAVSKPTRRLGSAGGLIADSASDRPVGLIFAAHPHVRARLVNLISWSFMMNPFCLLPASSNVLRDCPSMGRLLPEANDMVEDY